MEALRAEVARRVDEELIPHHGDHHVHGGRKRDVSFASISDRLMVLRR